MANTTLPAFEFLCGCWHRNLSRPFTLSGWTYEVYLGCGKKLAYDRADIGCVVAQRKNLRVFHIHSVRSQLCEHVAGATGHAHD